MRRVNIVSLAPAGTGLDTDVAILREALEQGGYRVSVNSGLAIGGRPLVRRLRRTAVGLGQRAHRALLRRPLFDLNLFVETIRPGFLPHARVNCLVPNPEWLLERDRLYLPRLDAVLCKTEEARASFDALGCRAEYVGFSSEDRRPPGGDRRDPERFFHLAGKNRQKGTEPLLELWSRHPEWPLLTVVQHVGPSEERELRRWSAANIDHRTEFLPAAELQRLQSGSGVHLCPSEAEGFGHSLVEAMSCGALILTTDAPPMNELVTPERGVLVAHRASEAQRLGRVYYVDPADLERKIEMILAMPAGDRLRLGDAARAWFEANDRVFRQRLVEVVGALLAPRRDTRPDGRRQTAR